MLKDRENLRQVTRDKPARDNITCLLFRLSDGVMGIIRLDEISGSRAAVEQIRVHFVRASQSYWPFDSLTMQADRLYVKLFLQIFFLAPATR